MLVKLGFQKDNAERNEPKGYKPATGAAPSSPGAGATAAAGAPPTQARALGVSRAIRRAA
jgi:hypothetical protein